MSLSRYWVSDVVSRLLPVLVRLPGLPNHHLKINDHHLHSHPIHNFLPQIFIQPPRLLAPATKMSFSPPLTPLVPPTDSSPTDDLVRHLSSLNLAHPDTRHDGTDQPLTGDAIDQASEGTVPYYSSLIAQLLTA